MSVTESGLSLLWSPPQAGEGGRGYKMLYAYCGYHSEHESSFVMRSVTAAVFVTAVTFRIAHSRAHSSGRYTMAIGRIHRSVSSLDSAVFICHAVLTVLLLGKSPAPLCYLTSVVVPRES